MFDLTNASRIIKRARIKKNMTQSALADLMGVTYQAVSNWERGSTLPDIAKLEDLCRILDIELYELIGSKDIEKTEEEKQLGKTNLADATADRIAAIAPLMPPEELMNLISKNKSKFADMSILIQLAPFVDGELIEELSDDIQPNHIGEIVALSPFISNETAAKLIERLETFDDFDLDVGLLSALGPFVTKEKMNQLSERVIPEDLTVLVSVAPFLSQEALVKMAERIEEISLEDYLIGVECLGPFIGKEALKNMYSKVVS